MNKWKWKLCQFLREGWLFIQFWNQDVQIILKMQNNGDSATSYSSYSFPRLKEDTDSQTVPMYNKIIASTEQIINSQAIKIHELNKQIKILEEENKIINRKYEVLLESKIEINKTAQNEQKLTGTNIDILLTKINDLEEEITLCKIEIAELKSSNLVNKQYQEIQESKKLQMMHSKSFLDVSFGAGKTGKNGKSNVQYFEVTELRGKIIEECKEMLKNELESQEYVLVNSWVRIVQQNLKFPELVTPKISNKFKEKTFDVAKRGIPKPLKSNIWPLLFDNPLGLSISTYNELLQYKRALPQAKKVQQQIDKDIYRSFYSRTEFQSKIGLREQIREILQIFHIYRPDISYVQGMTYPVIILDLIVGKYRAFIIFANLIVGNTFFRRLFAFEGNFVSIYCRLFEALLKENIPKLYDELVHAKKISAEVYLIEWFYTFFSRGFEYEITLRIWDMLAYEGELIFYKIGLSIFFEISDKLLGDPYQQTITTIIQFQKHLKCSQKKLLEKAINLKLSTDKFTKMLQKVLKEFDENQ